MWSERRGNSVAIALDPRSSYPGSGLLETLRSVFNKVTIATESFPTVSKILQNA